MTLDAGFHAHVGASHPLDSSLRLFSVPPLHGTPHSSLLWHSTLARPYGTPSSPIRMQGQKGKTSCSCADQRALNAKNQIDYGAVIAQINHKVQPYF